MKLTNCLIINSATGDPYTYQRFKTDEKGERVQAKNADGTPLANKNNEPLYEVENAPWTLFDIWLKLVGQKSVEGWAVDDLSLYFKVSNSLRRRLESGKPTEEQMIELKGETFAFARSQLTNALKANKEINVELAATVMAGMDGAADSEQDGAI